MTKLSITPLDWTKNEKVKSSKCKELGHFEETGLKETSQAAFEIAADGVSEVCDLTCRAAVGWLIGMPVLTLIKSPDYKFLHKAE